MSDQPVSKTTRLALLATGAATTGAMAGAIANAAHAPWPLSLAAGTATALIMAASMLLSIMKRTKNPPATKPVQSP